MLNLNVISKCVAKCEAKYLENIQIPKETKPGPQLQASDHTAPIARHHNFNYIPTIAVVQLRSIVELWL